MEEAERLASGAPNGQSGRGGESAGVAPGRQSMTSLSVQGSFGSRGSLLAPQSAKKVLDLIENFLLPYKINCRADSMTWNQAGMGYISIKNICLQGMALDALFLTSWPIPESCNHKSRAPGKNYFCAVAGRAEACRVFLHSAGRHAGARSTPGHAEAGVHAARSADGQRQLLGQGMFKSSWF